jgi:hypothetical protein
MEAVTSKSVLFIVVRGVYLPPLVRAQKLGLRCLVENIARVNLGKLRLLYYALHSISLLLSLTMHSTEYESSMLKGWRLGGRERSSGAG